MSESGYRVRLTVEVVLSADPIEGVLRHPHGAGKPFAGWVALIRALELALDTERAHSASSPPG
ncbi:hypothetical protein SAMN05444920_103599 [Nonomuraea solani]|uniref:Uncharacterized protein n=1 Tax=Nonomuraea solani TaxID=1144553 RepID=A0A1H6BRY2_9ACTN|nr:hypothetical protein [Nonomuraea solani]SEG63471.1 hypothetical protein SAMN05444920_103599 [Nonomuraea solani]